MIDIFEILYTKPHNKHYLDRYVKFIKSCQIRKTDETYFENHHIAPKASDLFPELIHYKNNIVSLTAREHIMAHVILWKAYGGSQALAATWMLECTDHNGRITSNSPKKIPEAIKIRFLAKSREEANIRRSDFHRNKAAYKDKNDNRYYLSTKDPLIEKLKLVFFHTGLKRSEKFKETLRGTPLYYPDGTYYGRLKKNDPLIEKLGLIHIRSKAQKRCARKSAKAAAKAKIGSNIWNNGREEKFCHEQPGDDWVLGRLPRSEEWETKRSISVPKRISGSTTWDDGVRNYRLGPNKKPKSHWKKGMAPQKPRDGSSQIGKRIYNDGIKNYRISKDDIPEPHWSRGMIKRTKVRIKD